MFIVLDVSRGGEILRFGAGEVERFWAKVDRGGADGGKTFAVGFADGT